MRIIIDELESLAFKQRNFGITRGESSMELKCKSIEIILHYRKTEEGVKIFQSEEDLPKEISANEERGTLKIEIDIDGFFGGPLVSFYDDKNLLLNLKRRSKVSLAVHLPEGGVSARDGVGDWTRRITLSEAETSI